MFNLSRAFSSFSVNDITIAQDYYSILLELPVEEISMGLLKIEFSPGKSVMIYEKEYHSPADFTILNFPVDNIEDAVDSLFAKGIRFEQYEEPIKTDEKGICSTGEGPKIAWFKDPFGNILSVLEDIEQMNGDTSSKINSQ